MIRWISALTLIANLFFSGFAQNKQASFALANVQTQYQFGGSLSVVAEFSGDPSLSGGSLVVQTSTGTPTSYPISINSNKSLKALVNLVDLNPQPFSRIYYWFELAFSNGTSLTTASYWFDYVDNRIQWQNNKTKWFTIYWSNGNAGYGDQLQTIALAGLKTATQILPISPDLPITIYVYPDQQSLQAVLFQGESSWIAGESLPGSNIILVSSLQDINNTQDLERQIPHEITHLLEYKLTAHNYSQAPTWLLEGLSTLSETYPDPDYQRALIKAWKSQTLLPMSQLCQSFSPDSDQAMLSYAQSASFVKFLTNHYGNDKIIQMLQTAGNGLSCSQLVQNTYNQSLDSLDSSWREETFSAQAKQSTWWSYWPIWMGFLVLLIAAIILRRYFVRRKENHNGA